MERRDPAARSPTAIVMVNEGMLRNMLPALPQPPYHSRHSRHSRHSCHSYSLEMTPMSHWRPLYHTICVFFLNHTLCVLCIPLTRNQEIILPHPYAHYQTLHFSGEEPPSFQIQILRAEGLAQAHGVLFGKGSNPYYKLLSPSGEVLSESKVRII